MITLNKVTASEFDFMFLLDASGSMGNKSTRYPGKTRWQELQETCIGLASEIGKWDADGLDVVVFGGNVETYNNVTAEKIVSVFENRDPRGGTPLTAALEVVVKRQKSTGKKTVALIFTDGEPENQETAARVIIDAAKQVTTDDQLTFLFIQIGNDPAATRYLRLLDDGLGTKFDIVDTVTNEEAEKMNAIDLINKAIND